VPTKKSVLVRQLMLRAAMGTLLGHDVGACLAPPDPSHMGTFARLASTRSAGLAAPTAGAATLPAAAGAAREEGPLALGHALACLDRMENGARHRQTFERFVGSARRECFDHVIQRSGLEEADDLYCSYFERSRTHLSLDKDTPISRPVMPPGDGTIVAIPEVGGLHHRCERRAA
jgi:hypothetical protein